MDSLGKNEKIVSQIQNSTGDRQELFTELWTSNIGLIRKIIHKLTGLQYGYPPDKEDFEDLEQQAFIGIMESVKHYDSTQGIKFFSFAQAYIRKSVYRYYDRSGQALRIPAYMRKHIRDYMSERDRLRKNGESVTNEIIQERLQLSDKCFENMIKTIQKLELQRLDSYLNESDKESGTILDMIAGNENTSEAAISSSYDTELKELLRKALSELPENERLVLITRHYQRMNNKHIASIMKCTPANVSRLAKSAYKRIRIGKYGKELSEFLPVSAEKRARKKIASEFKELSEEERDLLI